jgi:hypothetical protein
LVAEVPETSRSLPTGTCWPFVGEVIFTRCSFDGLDGVGLTCEYVVLAKVAEVSRNRMNAEDNIIAKYDLILSDLLSFNKNEMNPKNSKLFYYIPLYVLAREFCRHL